MHRLFALGLVWFAPASATIVSNSHTSVELMAGQEVAVVNVAYLIGRLVATVLIVRANGPTA